MNKSRFRIKSLPYIVKIASKFRVGHSLRYLNAFIGKIDHVFSLESPICGPTALFVEPTRGCNLDCSICSRSEFTKKNGEMSLDLFKEIVDKSKSIIKLTILGWGEPFLHPYIFEMMDYAYSNIPIVEIYSNGLAVDIDKIEQINVDKFWFSIDSLISERKNGRDIKGFDRVRDKIIKMSERKGMLVYVNITISSDNFKQIDVLCKELSNMNVSIVLSGLSGYDRYDSPKKVKPVHDQKEIIEKMQKSYGAQYRPMPPLLGKHCNMLWTSPFIDYTGDLTICWHRPEENCAILGNVKDLKTIDDAWYGDINSKNRKDSKNLTSNVCKDCMFRKTPYESR